MTDFKFLDSSVWIAYLLYADEKARELIDQEGIFFTSVLSVFEVKRKLLKEKVEFVKITQAIQFMKKKSVIIMVSTDVCEEAPRWSLPAMDSLIYESAQKNNVQLYTYDNDFRGLQGVTVLSENDV